MLWGERGQTNLDFAFGVSILVLTIVVALGFVPGMFDSIDRGTAQADEVAADRVASQLVEADLGHPSRPGRIDADCTVALFDGSGCGFSGSSVADNVGVEDDFVNVSVYRDGTIQCWDPDGGSGAGAFVDKSTGGCGAGQVKLAGDGVPGGSSNVGVARRPVRIDGYDATVVVRVW